MEQELSDIGRKQEFTKVYETYVDDIFRLCYSFLKNRMDAEDAVQETFLKYFHSHKKFESMEHRKSWLIVTASNHCKDILKQCGGKDGIWRITRRSSAEKNRWWMR